MGKTGCRYEPEKEQQPDMYGGEMDYQSLFTFILEMAGTIAFAASGAMVGAQRGMDIFGICVLGVVTAVGGGATRDIILGIVPPGMFQNPIYTIVATVTSCIVFAIMYWKQELLEGENRMVYDKIMLVMDSVGLGVFTVMGVDKGITEGYMGRTFFLVFLGTVTGVGGGLIRDMMAGVPPYIFVRHIYACASIVGAIVYVWIYRLWGSVPAMVIGTVVVILVRYLAAHYRWNLPRLRRE